MSKEHHEDKKIPASMGYAQEIATIEAKYGEAPPPVPAASGTAPAE